RDNDLAPLLSTDEEAWGVGSDEYVDAGGKDPLPVYLARTGDMAPIVYLDSRTYGVIARIGSTDVYNGFARPGHGGVRPYKSGLNLEPPRVESADASVNEAVDAVPFHNPDTFRSISPSLDSIYGASVGPDTKPVHFVTETVQAVRAETGTPAGRFS